ncbi:DUF4179 domain-containing protein [Gorillibacterium sp. CAU 1737]|uniref:DUF4179 domain-containing protein n=1 Tax=Gorillibacterium sp. CAU 1737 TaxID=3140362 RepID=UPI003260BACF
MDEEKKETLLRSDEQSSPLEGKLADSSAGNFESSGEKDKPTTLAEWKQCYTETPLPAGLDEAVRIGIERGARRRRTRGRSRLAAWSAAAVLVLFLGSVRVSPAFAAYISQIPGLESFVEWLTLDKGLQLAVDHDLVQEIGVSDTHDGVEFRVDGVIADEARIVIMYSFVVKTPGAKIPDQAHFRLGLYDSNGKRIEGGYAVSGGSSPAEGDTVSRVLEVELMEENNPAPQSLEVAMVQEAATGITAGEWKVGFDLDTAKFQGMRQEQELHHTFTSAGQTFTLKRAIYYPTRMKLEIDSDPNNRLHIFGLTGLSLTDEEGRVWTTKTATIDPDGWTVFFESSYFTRPKRLTLSGLGVNALPENERVLQLDLDSGKLTGGPADLSFEGSRVNGNDRSFTFKMPYESEHPIAFQMEKVTDSTEKAFESHLFESHQSDGGILEQTITFQGGKEMKGTLTFRISGYPRVERSPFTVEFETPFP